ncbi:hypothetical protein AZ34_05175 [Hylemonella gracilis str. Niagara R]|uniref:Uncharacterized protein n=1 Tax=Hylemonella gracilis str. Niagara R TaxID=1458275 RepID=A0A016XMJ7_9BURK|nr:hypothetical protein [Hylemonella gracilis]EYC52807.1 hypothetical protein AZ34_05175 [Hylemonella gracilis str. Niagara R]
MNPPEPPLTLVAKMPKRSPWPDLLPVATANPTRAGLTRTTDLARVPIEHNVPMRTVIASARVQRIELLMRMEVGDSVLVDHRTAARLQHETYGIDCAGIKVRVRRETPTSSRVWRLK